MPAAEGATPRTLTAATMSVIASSVVYAVVLGIAMRHLSGDLVTWLGLLAPGLVLGALFAVIVLIPLSYVVRGLVGWRRGLFAGIAIVAWCTVSVLLFAFQGLSVAAIVGKVALLLPAGLAAVVAFVLVPDRPVA